MKNVGSAWKTNTWHCLKDFLINHVHSHIHAAVYKGKKLSGMKISSELFRYLSIGLHWLSYLPYACVYNLSKYYFCSNFTPPAFWFSLEDKQIKLTTLSL